MEKAEEYGSFERSAAPKAKRLRLNTWSLVLSILLPWLVFFATLILLSSSVHYEHPQAATWLSVACLLVPIGCAYAVAVERYSQKNSPSWFSYLALTSFVAWLSGCLLGTYSWTTYLEPYYERAELGIGKNVTTTSPGGEYMDASVLAFSNTTYIDGALAMGFKAADLYCIAPFISGAELTPANATGKGAPASYDFWAVGINCCNPFQPASFSCGPVPQEGDVLGGMRLMSKEKQQPYRKALAMASAQYNITIGEDPVLMEPVLDPLQQLDDLRNAGHSLRLQASIAGLILFAVLAIWAAGQYKSI
jgi:hypothetical protein